MLVHALWSSEPLKSYLKAKSRGERRGLPTYRTKLSKGKVSEGSVLQRLLLTQAWPYPIQHRGLLDPASSGYVKENVISHWGSRQNH